MSANQLPVEHALVRSTVRLLAGPASGNPNSVGTGFFYKVVHPQRNVAKILIVTNKHVIRGAEVVHFVLSSAPSVRDLDNRHQPRNRKDQKFVLELKENTYLHPDPEIDLCGIDVTIPVGHVLQTGAQLRSMFLDSSWLPEPEARPMIRDVEQVLVVGYPRGLWDSHNNMPVARLGTTATHPLAHYQNKREFLVDVAAFQGSSGSPVFTYEAPMFRQHDGTYTPGTKVQFVGVVWGVVEWNVEGELKVVEIPSAFKQVPVVSSSLSLALAVQSDAILELDALMFPDLRNV